jgi:hypothetical protein
MPVGNNLAVFFSRTNVEGVWIISILLIRVSVPLERSDMKLDTG